MLCSTACPANCITIVAGEHTDKRIEKFPIKFQVDTLVCIYCGFCEEACPCDAIRMDSGRHTMPTYSREANRLGKVDLLALGSLSTAKQGGENV
jgi:NADH-quinone oxidoreductase subunit I